MSRATARADATIEAAVGRNLDLVHRFLLAALDDPPRYESLPADASTVLLPDDAPEILEANLAMAVQLARKGRNVFLRHILPADLPEPGAAGGPGEGDRRATYDEAGNVVENLVFGADGAWHPTDEPLPRDGERV